MRYQSLPHGIAVPFHDQDVHDGESQGTEVKDGCRVWRRTQIHDNRTKHGVIAHGQGHRIVHEPFQGFYRLRLKLHVQERAIFRPKHGIRRHLPDGDGQPDPVTLPR